MVDSSLTHSVGRDCMPLEGNKDQMQFLQSLFFVKLHSVECVLGQGHVTFTRSAVQGKVFTYYDNNDNNHED